MSSRKQQKQSNRLIREQLAAERRRKRTMLVTLVSIFAVVLAGLISLTVYETHKPKNVNVPAGAIDSGHGIAVSSGPVTVDLYVDLLCPICKNFEDTTGPTLDQMITDKKIKLVYHPIAILDHSTNPAGYSTRAGSAAGCAADGGKFFDFVKAMYAKQPAEGSAGLTDDEIVQVGAGVGLIDPAFAQCVRAEKYSSWMADNTDAAAARNVNGTPTVFVNGKQVDATTAAVTAAVNGAS
ncbi:MAG TPA: thioredoxin domain-containing protein [Rugosimonospora sp.]|nr:thioredoxin domain-containing protein [Rugosimonospora sp.]